MAEMNSIPCHETTRDHIRSLKADGETYDELLEKMSDLYAQNVLEA